MRFAFTALLAGALVAQAAPQDGAAALKESLAQNQAALRKYSWVETTQVSLKGEVKKQEQKQCYYGADGKVQKTPMAAAAAPQQKQAPSSGGKRGGRLKEEVVEKKVDEMKDYMEKAAALVHQYVPPDPQKIEAAKAAGHVATQPGSAGALMMTITNYLKQGDSLAIGLDTAAKKLSSYTVHSYVEKPKEDDVDLAVMFGRLEDGTSFPQQIVLDVKAKQVQVKVTNSGYKKTGA